MAKVKGINIPISADASSVVTETDKAAEAVKNLKRKADKDVADFQKAFARSSGIDTKALGSAFSGKGLGDASLAGVQAFAAALNAAAQKAKEVATEIRTGGNVAQALGKTINDIPIVGQFKQAGEAIREVIRGEEAAKIETEKWHQALNRIADTREAIRADAALRGKYGDERASIEIDNRREAELHQIAKQKEALQKEKGEIESKVSNRGATQAQIDALRRVDNERKALEEKEKNAIANAKQARIDQAAEIADREAQIHFEANERLEAGRAAVQEKVLRREGRGIESAMVAIKERERAEVAAAQNSLRAFNLRGLSTEVVAQRQKDASDRIKHVHAESALAIAELQKIEADKAEARAIENADRLEKIKSEAEIRRLENLGQHYAAERKKADEAYREEVEAAKKKYREQRELDGEQAASAAMRDEIAAAALKHKYDIEAAGMQQQEQARKVAEKSQAGIQLTGRRLDFSLPATAVAKSNDKAGDILQSWHFMIRDIWNAARVATGSAVSNQQVISFGGIPNA